MAPVRTVQVLKGDGLGGAGGAREDGVRADHGPGEDGVGVGDGVDGTVSAPVEEVSVAEPVLEAGVHDSVEDADGAAGLAVELAEGHGDGVWPVKVVLLEGEVRVPRLGVVAGCDVDGGAR